MKTVYELTIRRRKVDVLMGVLTLTDDEGNANDNWTFTGDGAIELPDGGHWFRTDSYSKVTLVGQENRIAADFQYHAWPLTVNRLGFLRTLDDIKRGRDKGSFYYAVERIA